VAKRQKVDLSAEQPLVYPEEHTHRLSFDGPTKRVQVHCTPHLVRCLEWVRGLEAEKGNKMSLSRTARAIILLGIQRYKVLKGLPDHEV